VGESPEYGYHGARLRKVWGGHYLSLVTNCDMVARSMVWRDRGKRRPPRRRPHDHVAGQVGTARQAQSNPPPSDLFTPTVISFPNHARITVASENPRAEITGGQVPSSRDLLQLTVLCRAHSVFLAEQLEGSFSSISM
jgi:hypothetical protein